MADVNKDQKATPYRLAKARSSGQVAKSPEFVATVVLGAAALIMHAHGSSFLQHEFDLASRALVMAGRLTDSPNSYATLIKATLGSGVMLVVPLFFAMMLVAVVVNIAHAGIAFSLDPLHWKLSRLNPATGLKRIFSARGSYNALRVIFKLIVLGWILESVCRNNLAHFILLGSSTPRDYLQELVTAISSLVFHLLAGFAFFALLDLGYSRFQFGRDMRMSRRDIKDDAKRRDGDPRIRARIRKLRLEAYKRAMASNNVKKADVLIVNPTHIAIALTYDQERGGEPVVVAKGAGSLAKKMRQAASSAGIPIVENRPLARALFKRLEIQQAIPVDLFADVARIIVWVLARRRAASA